VPEPRTDTQEAQVVLVTCSDERYQEPESHVVAAALEATGVRTDVVAWDAECDWGAYRLVVVRTPWDYFDRVTEFLEWAAKVERQTTLVNPADVLRWNAHKGYLVELTAKGIPTVPTVLIPGPSTDVADQIREVEWEEIVVKPAVDGAARHAWRGRRDDPALSRVTERLTDHGDVIVQPFVPAIVDGERSLVFFGGQLSHAVRKVPQAGDYRSQRHLGGTELDHQPDSAELQVALAAMAAAPGRLTYARVDLVDWEGAPAVIELEVIEPDLFLRDVPERSDRFVDVLLDELVAARAV
jgi:glutathione synthase/RimK-type ligase-like ATP-grasp enzyme